MLDTPPAREALFVYRGRSMWPLLQTGDLLMVRRVPLEKLRAGDCIVFRKPGGDQNTVHRIARTKPGIRTRGDARPVLDSESVDPSWIQGRAEARIRYGHARSVWGGTAGRWAGAFYRHAGRLDPSRDTRGGRIARLIQCALGPITALCLRQARVASFRSGPGRSSHYLLIGKRIVVGIYDECAGRWSCVWPYSLLTDLGVSPPLEDPE